MIHINLLPHREEKRKARRQQFYSLIALVAILASLAVLLGYTILGGYVSDQESKNALLKREIAALDAQIDQIKRLKEQTQALLARKQVIESLQRDRSDAVNLFNELARKVPEGVYLKSVKQEGQRVTISGYAQSNSRVSTLMRNLEDSSSIKRPVLVEIKAVTVDKRKLNEFILFVQLSSTPETPAGTAGAKTAKEVK